MWVRKGRFSELNAILACDPLAVDDMSRHDRIETGISNGTCWVAGDQTAVCGYTLVLPDHFFGFDFVDLIVVSENQRRKGYGHALMNAAECYTRHTKLFSSTNRSNEPMRAVFHARNYILAGEVYHLDVGDPELIFVKYCQR